MDLVLANDLQELHQKYTGPQILDKVRKFFEILDGKRYNNEELFIRTLRAYNSANKGYEAIAKTSYENYRRTKEVPLQIARCLLPSPHVYPYRHYEPAY